jgi:hypothetical protein
MVALMMRRWVAGLLAVIGVVVGVGTLEYRHTYGTWWQTPERIPYCGRTFLAAKAGLSLAEVRRLESQVALPGDSPYPLITVGTVPPVVGQPLLASPTPEATGRRLGVTCAMGVYLKTGADSYTTYVISGGP